ncbi:glycosyltransferase family 25 protein, partial [Escherichia coli]
MNNLEIRVLSLPDAYARRTKFQERFSLVSKLKFQFFDGVYGKNIPDEILKS